FGGVIAPSSHDPRVLFGVPTPTIRAPKRLLTSGIRNEPPISTICPRETTTSLPRQRAASARSTAAALLLTTSAASQANSAVRRPDRSAARSPRLPVSRSSSRLL